MADDQGPKIASIDELVNELTKKNPPMPSSGNPAPSTPPKPLPIQPKQSLDTESRTLDSSSKSNTDLGRIGAMSSQFQPNPVPTPTPTSKPPVPQPEIPKPRFTTPPPLGPMPLARQARPAPSPALFAPSTKSSTPPAQIPSAPLIGGPIKEYQSSIRTMKDDISTLKQGQKPAGIDIPRIIQPPAPPLAPAAPKPPVPGQPQQFKMPTVNLGQAQKTGPLSQTKESASPADRPTPPSVRGPISPPVGRPAPVSQKPQIYTPPLPTGGISDSRNRLFGLIAGAAVLFGVLYWFLVLRVPEPEIALKTPTPTPVATPVINLNSIFQGISIIARSFENNSEGIPIIADLKTRIDKATIAGGEFQNLIDSLVPDLVSFLDAKGVEHPQGLVDLQGNDFLPLLYGQEELFDSKGQIKLGSASEKRLVLINEVKNASAAFQLGKDWEAKMPNDLKTIFQLDIKKQANIDFMDNIYRGVSIRYNNFSYADRSIDYAIVSGVNGKSYLVIGNSRELMYSTIDKLMGF